MATPDPRAANLRTHRTVLLLLLVGTLIFAALVFSEPRQKYIDLRGAVVLVVAIPVAIYALISSLAVFALRQRRHGALLAHFLAVAVCGFIGIFGYSGRCSSHLVSRRWRSTLASRGGTSTGSAPPRFGGDGPTPPPPPTASLSLPLAWESPCRWAISDLNARRWAEVEDEARPGGLDVALQVRDNNP